MIFEVELFHCFCVGAVLLWMFLITIAVTVGFWGWRERVFPRVDEEVFVCFELFTVVVVVFCFGLILLAAVPSSVVVPFSVLSGEDVGVGEGVAGCGDYVEGFCGSDAAGTVLVGDGAEGGAGEEGAVVWVCGGALGGFEGAAGGEAGGRWRAVFC